MCTPGVSECEVFRVMITMRGGRGGGGFTMDGGGRGGGGEELRRREEVCRVIERN